MVRNIFYLLEVFFKPNIEGIIWFAQNVAKHMDVNVCVVGKGMEQIAVDSFPDNVKVLGGVEDLGIYYSGALGVIMPIFTGYGMKVKTAEAMMYGKPILATDEALRGYAIDNLEWVYRCNTSDEFIRATEDVLKKQVYFYPKIREYFDINCSTRTVRKKIEMLLLELTHQER